MCCRRVCVPKRSLAEAEEEFERELDYAAVRHEDDRLARVGFEDTVQRRMDAPPEFDAGLA